MNARQKAKKYKKLMEEYKSAYDRMKMELVFDLAKRRRRETPVRTYKSSYAISKERRGLEFPRDYIKRAIAEKFLEEIYNNIELEERDEGETVIYSGTILLGFERTNNE